MRTRTYKKGAEKRRALTREGSLHAKKSLGQHFLTSHAAVRAMADAGDVGAGDTVLEIGPGTGILTAELLARGAQVVAIEKDTRMIPFLAGRFAAEAADGRLRIIEADALTLDPSDCGLRTTDYKLIANIPYYITGALFEKYLSGKCQPSVLVFLVQKEIAERIARSHKESLLSLSVKAYGEPHYVKTVPRGAFSPAPSVDSAILAVEHVSRKRFNNAAHEARFFALLKTSFAHKRKLLARNAEALLGNNPAESLTRAGLAPTVRAEDVPLEAWLALADTKA